MTEASTAERGILIEVDFGDTELVVRRHPDGMVTIEIPEERVVISEADFQRVLRAFCEYREAHADV